jgi:plasmid stabilization system protein ParE
MSIKPVEFDEAAADEVDEAHLWYFKRSTRAADSFLMAVRHAISEIQQRPATFAKHLHGTQRYLLRRYPYAVVYRELPDSIQIVAVAHTKRRPGYWKARV